MLTNRLLTTVLASLGAVVAAGTTRAAAPVEPVLNAGVWSFGSRELTVAVDAAAGGLVSVAVGGRVLAAEPAPGVSPDVRENGAWLVAERGTVPTLVSVAATGPAAVAVTTRLGAWEIVTRYGLEFTPARLRRSLTLTYRGEAETKLGGVRLPTPLVALPPDGEWFSPGSYPPERHTLADTPDGRRHSFGQGHWPLIARPAPALALVWLTDLLAAGADNGSVVVTGAAGGIRVTQQLEAVARARPGATFEVGDAWLGAVAGDAEAALRAIGDWLVARSTVVPADRPAWFTGAVLYAFHPGGTIGGQFRDLGGFVPATAFLDSIADTGANAIWLLPIEDASVYHPRDYYRFQAGLGDAAQYRALVDRAHALGLMVLQDCVPHGGRNDYPRAKEHPEWLAYLEDGTTYDYWCYDFNWPTWREYMAGVARHYVSTYGVDGFRVDACSGSRTPNWNPAIPYGRASFAQLQGGLNMLRDLRRPVRELKPATGGLLAEVDGSIYGTTSDAVYDFTLCYTVLHDVRRLPAAEFVARLRTWLHEQQAAELPDLVRLRHVESHDSLRSMLWYGPDPQRALLAITAWIHGMPLVYHEMEEGNRAVYQRVFAIRQALPELRGGAADYLAAKAPDGVFACVRSSQTGAAVAVVSLRDTPVSGALRVPVSALPSALRSSPAVRDAWLDRELPEAVVRDGELVIPCELPAFGFTVYPVREAPTACVALPPDAWAAAGPGPAAAPTPPEPGQLVIHGAGYVMQIDPTSGLWMGAEVAGQPALGPADLFLSPDVAAQAGPASVRREGGGGEIVVERGFGPGRALVLRYRPEGETLRIRAEWTGPEVPPGAAIYAPFVDAARWYAESADGLCEDRYLPRHLTTTGERGSIYWRLQGTNALWDSLVHPLGQVAGRACAGALGARCGGTTPAFVFGELRRPVRVRFTDRLGERRELGLTLAWADPEVPLGRPAAVLEFEFVPGRAPAAPQWLAAVLGQATTRVPAAPAAAVSTPATRLRPTAGGWVYENAHYRLRLSRAGTIAELWALTPVERLIVRGGDLYTDAGFGAAGERYGAANDVEAALALTAADDRLGLRFEGRARGFGRFDLPPAALEYVLEYTLGDGPSFRLAAAVRPAAGPAGDRAFLALFAPVPAVGSFRFARGADELAAGSIGDGRQRATQTALLPGAPVPDTVEVSGVDGRLLALTGIAAGGGLPVRNVFVHGQNLFLCWYDGVPPAATDPAWSWVSALWTPGVSQPVPVGGAACDVRNPDPVGLLRDPGFEESVAGALASLRSGTPIPGPAATRGAWTGPGGGSVVSTPVHGGRGAAEVVNRDGAYALWRQVLPLAQLPAGSRWRVSAWVKGDGIVMGDVGWKVGTLRFAVTTDKTSYASSPELTGTFDWREVAAEVTITPDARSVAVEAGLNGANGRLWLDDLHLERLPPE